MSDGTPVMRSGVAMHPRTFTVPAAFRSGRCERMSAAAPATCGVAMLVPLIVLVAESEEDHAPRTLEPGAKMSTHGPFELKEDMVSADVVDPTVTASGAAHGGVQT